MVNIAQVFVGIDVSKKYLDIHIHPINIPLKIDNTVDGIVSLIKILTVYKVEVVGFESSGGYEYLLKTMLEKHVYKTWLIQPKRVKAYIYSEGINYKTDASDAKMIALFVAQKECKYNPHVSSDEDLQLRALVTRRSDLTTVLNMEKNRFNSPMQLYCKNEIKKHIVFIEKQMVILERTISMCIAANSGWKRKAQILESVPGIGKVTVATLLANVPELGNISGKKIAALIGVAPFVKQSGTYKGKSVVIGGRTAPRKTLYMATLVAVRHNEMLKKFYQRLVDAGKAKKVALVAAMRKLIVIVNIMLKKNETWSYKVA